MHLRALLGFLLVALGLSRGVAAQVITAQCPPGWEWVSYRLPSEEGDILLGKSLILLSQNRNSLSQDPCVVATILDSHCRNERERP
jgi:hypothetical protein